MMAVVSWTFWINFHIKLKSGLGTFLEIFSRRRRSDMLVDLGFKGLLKGAHFLFKQEQELCLEYQQILKQETLFLFKN